ncbi:MAG: NlpC/P60 family protein [Cellulosilyticaceae bacterium]
MKFNQLIGMTVLAVAAMSQTIMATPVEDATLLTDRLEMMVTPYVGSEEEVKQVIDEIKSESSLSEEILAEGTLTKIIVEEAKLRNKPSEDADITNYLVQDAEVVAIEMIDNWYKVKTNEAEGYIYKTQVDETALSLIPYTRTEENQIVEAAPEVSLGEEVVTYAKQFLGNPYVYGGNSLTNGVDCSGFTSQVYKHFDVKLERSSRSQYASNGYKVKKADLLPGDLVFYGYNGYIDHVAIYAGSGEVIHASSPKTGIKMSKLEYGKPIIGIKRVI